MPTTASEEAVEPVIHEPSRTRTTSPPMLLGRKLLKKVATRYDAPSRRIGALYAFDRANHRIVAFNKENGDYLGQYQLTGDSDAWSDLQGLDVLPTADAEAPSTLWWISSNGLNSALLEEAPEETPTVSPGPEPTKAAATPKPKPKPTKKPNKKPRN